jgi:REP element-mobilizing transposase RayT
MKPNRLLGRGDRNYYHMMSRVIEGRFIFEAEEQHFFYYLMRKLEAFMGVKVLTYCIMSNHFHILLEVTSNHEIDDAEILRRVDNFYPKTIAKEVRDTYEKYKQEEQESGNAELIKSWRTRYLNRMGDLSNFGKELKEGFSRWYNRRVNRRGPLWMERFKSVLIEESELALSTISSYIDLNPVRAGIVKDPKVYRYCGYAEAIGGGIAARSGICALAQMIRRDVKKPNWKDTAALYRRHLFAAGDGKGIDSKRVKEVFAADGKLSRKELLCCRVRYFSDGLAFGSKSFINKVFSENRSRFGKKRIEGARPVKKTDELFFTLKDLRNEPIRVPI